MELFREKSFYRYDNYLSDTCANIYSDGYLKLFWEMHKYIDNDGNFDKQKWVQNHFHTVARANSKYGDANYYYPPDNGRNTGY